MGRKVAGIAALLVCALALGSSGARGASGGLIVFPGTPPAGGATQLYPIAPDGTGLKQLTTGSYAAVDPVFSPDGKRIAFVRATVGIFTMNRDGSGLKRLTVSARDTTPTYSPDGKSIAFTRPQGT